ncbi:MAG: hypothetical protein MMC33_009214 [Icmadophila ericetorum]|nr:hypothetical protein [Icmadophila ericetorum]
MCVSVASEYEGSQLRNTKEYSGQLRASASVARKGLDILSSMASRLLPALLPSFLSPILVINNLAEPLKLSPTSHLDGLRGIAALFVYVGHFVGPFYADQFQHGYGYGSNRSVVQLPIIRLAYSGSPMVSVFFVISGFVLSIKPLKLMKAREWDRILQTVASATFRRAIRLFSPVFVSTFLVSISVWLRLFEIDFKDVPPGITVMRPVLQESLWAQLKDWGYYVATTLTDVWSWKILRPGSNYGGHLWTITFEFRCSMLLFLTHVGISRLSLVSFYAISLSSIVYCLAWEKWDFAHFIAGMLLAKASLYGHPAPQEGARKTRRSAQILSSLLAWACLFVGLYFASFPNSHGAETPGYVWLARVVAERHNWELFGTVMIVWSLSHIAVLQRGLTTPIIQYLGRISFSFYIIHEPLLHVFGWSLVKKTWLVTGNTSSFRYQLGTLVAFLLLTPLIICIADVFWRLVDVPSMALARWVEGKCFVPFTADGED